MTMIKKYFRWASLFFILIQFSTPLPAAENRQVEPTLKNIPYGESKSQVINVWKAKSDKPTPVLFMIHGGGWYGGQKDEVLTNNYWLEKGVSVVSIDYRLSGEAILPAPVMDAARALQFVRYKAAEWGFDKTKIAVTGGSAGGCTSLWLAFHDDLADPNSDDPIARESTKPLCAFAHNGQASIEPQWVLDNIGKTAAAHGMLSRSVGAQGPKDLVAQYAKYQQLTEKFSPRLHMDKNDPPVALKLSFPLKDTGIHSPWFGIKLKEEANKSGVDLSIYTKEKHPLSLDWKQQNQFLLKHLLNK